MFLHAFLEGMSTTFYTKAKFEVTKEGLYCELPTEPTSDAATETEV